MGESIYANDRLQIYMQLIGCANFQAVFFEKAA